MKMNRSLLLGLAVAVSLGLALLANLPRPAAAQPAKPAPKIEYSTLSFCPTPTDAMVFVDGKPVLVKSEFVNYVAGDKCIAEKNWGQMCQRLGRKEGGSSSVDGMNVLGKDGWELVAAEFRPDPAGKSSGMTFLYLKRQQ